MSENFALRVVSYICKLFVSCYLWSVKTFFALAKYSLLLQSGFL